MPWIRLERFYKTITLVFIDLLRETHLFSLCSSIIIRVQNVEKKEIHEIRVYNNLVSL